MFKSTGFIRRIDESGRISIPKELRKKHRLDDNVPVEIGENEENLVLKRYSRVGQFSDSSKSILESFYSITGLPVILCDTDSVIVSPGIASLKGEKISDELYEHIRDKSERIPSVPILKEGDMASAEVQIIYSLSRIAVGALVIPDCSKEIRNSQVDCLRLCAKAIGQLIG